MIPVRPYVSLSSHADAHLKKSEQAFIVEYTIIFNFSWVIELSDQIGLRSEVL